MHLEVIPLKAKEIFDKLRHFPNFYLAGGTGLALQIGHRISIGFDLFWEKDIPKTLLQKIRKIFTNLPIEIVVNHSEELTVAIKGINVSVVKYPFPIILKFINYKGLKVLSALEIAAMKAYALGRRATLKDYVDLYFVLKKKLGNLNEIIKICERKYSKEFSLRLFLEQLIYSKDIEEMEIQFLKKKINKKEIEKFFEKEIRKIKI